MYQQALGKLGQPLQTQVRDHITQWGNGGDARWGQVAANIENETALSADDFAELLRAFCGELDNGADPARAWRTACHANQFKGHRMTDDERPGVLGRAVTRKAYVRHIAQDNRLSAGNAEKTLRRVLRASREQRAPQRVDAATLRKSVIGRHVVWATFSDKHPDDNPFAYLSQTAEAIRTALGLGHIGERETFILLVYRSEAQEMRIELHRPTIGDAADHPHYRPCSAGSPHGWTNPLSPNPWGVGAQPEVVHDEIVGATILFPLYETK